MVIFISHETAGKGGKIGATEASQECTGLHLVQFSQLLYAGAIVAPISQIRRLRLKGVQYSPRITQPIGSRAAIQTPL